MELLGIAHSGHITLAFARDHMHKHRAVGIQHGSQRFPQLRDVVPVDRRRAYDAQLLEDHGMGNDELLHRFLHAAAEVGDGLAHRSAALQVLLHVVARLAVLRRCAHVTQMLHERTNVVRDGHLVVVQDDDHGRLSLADVVQRLEGHAAGKRRIADERDDLLVGTRQIAGLRQAERHRKRVGCVPGIMHVVGALAGLGEAGETAIGAKRAEILQTSGDQLVRIRLMPHVEHDLVLGAIEQAVQRQDDLDRAQRRGNMTTGFRGGGHNLLTNLARKYR